MADAEFRIRVMVEVVIIIILIITLKGTVQDFYNLLTVLGTVSNTYAPVARVQHIKRLTHANVLWYVVRRDSSAIKFDRVYVVSTITLFS